MKYHLAETALARPIVISVLILMSAIGLSLGVSKLSFEGHYRIWFGDDNRELRDLDHMHTNFTKADSIAVIVKPRSGSVYTARGLKLIEALTAQLWNTPLSSRVDSITNFQHTESRDGDLIVDYLLSDRRSLTDEEIAKIRAIAGEEPLLIGRLVSKSGTMALVNVSVNMPGDDLSGEPLLVQGYVAGVIEDFTARYPDYTFHATGIVAMNASFAQSVAQDSSTLMPVLFVMTIVALGILTRSIYKMLAITVVIVLTIVSTLGLAGWLGIMMNNATVNVPIMVMTLAVADCLHIVVFMTYRMRRGVAKTPALRESLARNFKPILITSVTTACGFLTMNYSEAPPMRDLGNLVAFGVMLAFLYAMTLFPLMLHIIPFKVTGRTDERLMRVIASSVMRYRHLVLSISMVTVLGLTACITLVDTSDEPLNYFGEEMEFRKSAELMAKDLSGITSIEYSLDSGSPSGINDPVFLHSLARYVDWLRAQPEVDHVLSVSDVIKMLNSSVHDDDQLHYAIPDNRNEAAQYMLLYEMSLPLGLDLKNLINLNKSETRVIVTLKNMGSKELLAFNARAHRWLGQNNPTTSAKSASINLIYGHIGERNILNMLLGVVAALFVISVILVFAFRSISLGLISVLSNVFPVLIGFGIWGALGGQINMAMAVVASMTIGIIVDDTVHFLLKYQAAREKYTNVQRAIHSVFSHVGTTLLKTTLVLCLGFSVLLFSQLDMNVNIGRLTIIVIVSALIIDLIVLPAFLATFTKTAYLYPKQENWNEKPVLLVEAKTE